MADLGREAERLERVAGGQAEALRARAVRQPPAGLSGVAADRPEWIRRWTA